MGFDRIGVIDVTTNEPRLEQAGQFLQTWIEDGHHGDMGYMFKHGAKRWRPADLLPGTTRVISLRLHYLSQDTQMQARLEDPTRAYISRYALGRDYHKTFRQKLQKLQAWIQNTLAPSFDLEESYAGRAFVDSAPVMEKAIAQASGLGWIGKNTLVIDTAAGSWFFLGEIFTNVPMAPTLTPVDPQPKNHCGSCTRCIEVCPTKAIVAPNKLDARRCISYLTIENKGPIPLEFRKAIGNRIFGCDDCQLFCPWNRFAKTTSEPDFTPRFDFKDLTIAKGLTWTAADFDLFTQGSALRRAGYAGWLRNLAVAAGNQLSQDPQNATVRQSLKQAQQQLQQTGFDESLKAMIQEHIDWALSQGE